jgi:hypothetical protein
MLSSNTGPTAPGWIRDQIEIQERIWPIAVLGTGLAFCIFFDACLGILIWTAASVIYYARP